jgi:hypothetical protein
MTLVMASGPSSKSRCVAVFKRCITLLKNSLTNVPCNATFCHIHLELIPSPPCIHLHHGQHAVQSAGVLQCEHKHKDDSSAFE